jgi:hypothetical protein
MSHLIVGHISLHLTCWPFHLLHLAKFIYGYDDDDKNTHLKLYILTFLNV